MSSFKALISKSGSILSITEEEMETTTDPRIDVASGSKYPDTIIVTAKNKEEAEMKVQLVLETWKQSGQNNKP